MIVRTFVRRVLARVRDDRGLTLIELLIATLLASVILLAAFSALEVGTKAEKGQQARHDAMLEIRQAMTRLTKDLRQATWIDPTSNHDALKMKTLMTEVTNPVAVTYQLQSLGGDLFELRRSVGGGPALSIVTNMVINTTSNPDPAFCYSYYSAGSPSECIDSVNPDGGRVPSELTAIRITLAKDPEFNPGEPITLATDVELRNL
jgi:prepilin-type N-terminal cleavage/methylation domain-containing protein